MLAASESFPEQLSRVQQQFKQWSPFDQLYATVELTRSFQLSYRRFLLQLFQSQILSENNDMFKHIVDDANTPDIVSCLLSNTLDKILFTLQLYLPLVSTTDSNEKLIEAYRDVLASFDANLAHPSKYSQNERQLINSCQQILFFLQTNPLLAHLTAHVPNLILAVRTKQFAGEGVPYTAPIQRYSSIRSQAKTTKTTAAEEMHAALNQQLTRLEINDSGVDLTESTSCQSLQAFLSAHALMDRNNPKHTFVGKTASSPIPEHGALNPPARTPLKSVLSAPSPTLYSDPRHKSTSYQQLKHRSVLPKSDEDEQESSPPPPSNELAREKNSVTDVSRPLGQFHSLRHRPVKSNQSNDDVSQYLGVDAQATPGRNTFLLPNTGMSDVPKWLKNLRLHKYDVFFAQMTYDEMMNLTMDRLKDLGITDGACSKILLNIKKLKERPAVLKQCLLDLSSGQAELANVVVQLSEVLSTPIRSKQLEPENSSEEDLPQLIVQILENVYQQVTTNTPSDICNSLLGLFDRCYKHVAFTDKHRHILLHWRGRLSSMLQSLGKIEFKKIQSAYSHNPQRRESKPPVRPIRSSTAMHYSSYPSTSTPLTKFVSDPAPNNLMEPGYNRRPNRSPTQMYPTSEEPNDASSLQTSFTGLTSTPPRNNGAYLANNKHQTLVRKASIDPYGESNGSDKTKLCKTFSDPNRIRFHNLSPQAPYMQPSLARTQQAPPLQPPPMSLFQMISAPYSQQQQRSFVAHSPPNLTNELSTSPIQRRTLDEKHVDYYECDGSVTSMSNGSAMNDMENSDEHGQNHTEMESLCREVTESAISDDVSFAVHDTSALTDNDQ